MCWAAFILALRNSRSLPLVRGVCVVTERDIDCTDFVEDGIGETLDPFGNFRVIFPNTSLIVVMVSKLIVSFHRLS
jgi:hypothetical protein